METASLAMGNNAAPPTRFPEFRDLYEEQSEAVYYAALRVTGNAADAEDVLQTVFLKMLDGGPALDAAWSPGAYLRRAAANTAIDLLRRRKSRRESDVGDLREPGLDYLGPAADPHDDSFALKERLRAALARLPAQNAEMFVLCYLEGYSYDELAELLQIERGTVGSRLHRIKAALQKDLGNDLPVPRSTS
jgi:RNA polymerase sigma-70 factor (ECF subfamily)